MTTERMQVDLELEVCTLADLIEACQAIHNETNAQPRHPVHPSEIRIESKEFNRIWLSVSTQTLTDGSQVYNVEVR